MIEQRNEEVNEPLLKEPIDEKKKKNGGSTVSGTLVLLVEFFERISYYSLMANLLLFLITILGISSIDSIIIVLVFNGEFFLNFDVSDQISRAR